MSYMNSNLLPKTSHFNNFKDIEPDVSVEQIKFDIQELYDKLCGELVELDIFFTDMKLGEIALLIFGDLCFRVEQDPIAIAPSFIYNISRSFKVIFYYRIAHALYYLKTGDDKIDKACKYYAFFISEEATKDTAIEIHPQARIGSNFVIDHGVNTIIGATSEIGNNCTLLNNVLLGSRKITYNPSSKRHPTLGNNVHVAGGVRILGPVHIGDNTKISPDCVILNNVPSHSIIKKITVQIVTTQNS